jgi:hypothetical protein
MNVRGYSEVENIWNPSAKQLLGQRVFVQEKLDGSQFAFSREGARSKRKELLEGAVPDLFAPAMKWVSENVHRIGRGAVFYCEAIAKPRHNTLTYDFAPDNGFVVFDIEEDGQWLSVGECSMICTLLGVPYAQVFEHAMVLERWDQLEEFLEHESILGGRIEGVVAKPIDRSILDPHSGRPLLVKVVRPEFREKNQEAQKEFKRTASLDSQLKDLVELYKTDARFEKAVQRLRDESQIKGELRDLAVLIPEVTRDILKEEENAFKEVLWTAAVKQIRRRVSAWLPEWYKERLLAQQEQA